MLGAKPYEGVGSEPEQPTRLLDRGEKGNGRMAYTLYVLHVCHVVRSLSLGFPFGERGGLAAGSLAWPWRTRGPGLKLGGSG